MFTGSYTALITPFAADGTVDENAVQDFVAWQIAKGVDGVTPVGTTGEASTLSHDERERVVKLCVSAAGGRVPVMAGAGSNSTRETIELAQGVQAAGADAALIVVPYYNTPTQHGLYEHFKAVHDATDISIVLYNIPKRSAIDMSADTMARLAELPRVIGVKDATGDLSRPLFTRARIGPDFRQLSGEDATATAFLAQGGHGCVSVSANVAPGLCADLHHAWARGDYTKVFELRDRLAPVHAAMFCENSPAPAKYGASLLGKCQPLVRQPLGRLTEAGKARVEAAMKAAGIL